MEALDYSQEQRDVLANMLMRSIRGNWNSPEPRARMLIELAEAGLTDYPEETVKQKAKRFVESGGHVDGRIFRSIYESGPRISEQTDLHTAKSLVGHLPMGDLTFDATTLERRFEDE